ncbi:hypothetical protein PVAP13_7KG317700 [Panicum virgatum]|uniref:RBR-type E3 ubiquitin transferase n=1 Tax=Panicum virgatum TaxID=38727 RepID=A0A8T0QPF0_PANVG|nr:hypothetical protein PVAP13_7KG317700 [Panicum virgatum]
MAAAAFPGTASRRIPELHLSGQFSDETSSSSCSSSDRAESSAVACEGGGEAEEGLLDLDSPWVAAAEAESRLEAAAAAAVAAGLGYRAEDGHEEEEDEIRDNQQRQEDELMALEAIYGDDLVVYENKGRLQYFQIYIHYDVADGVNVCAKLSAPNTSTRDVGCFDSSEHDCGPDEFSYTCNFEYLPPLILTCLLPKSYPSKDPPSFAVTAKWMDGPYVSQLCEMLDTIWAELSGQEVVYQWVEWLRNTSRSYLWTDGSMTLGPDIVTHNTDICAIPRTKSIVFVIPLMLSYRNKKRYQAFLEDLHMCMICLNQTKGSNFIRLPCEHFFCVKCMETLCRMHVKEGSVFQLVCPGTKCKDSIPPYVLKRLLTEEQFERWDRLLLQKTLDLISDIVFCSRCVIGCVEDENNNAQCPECSFIFCSFCKGPWHPGKQCLTPEQKIHLRKASGRMTEREVAQEMRNIRELYKDVRLCPKCRMGIAKTEGCNKMTCTNCGQYFCFACGVGTASFLRRET